MRTSSIGMIRERGPSKGDCFKYVGLHLFKVDFLVEYNILNENL